MRGTSKGKVQRELLAIARGTARDSTGGPAKKLTLQIRAIEPLCARDDLLALANARKIVITQRGR